MTGAATVGLSMLPAAALSWLLLQVSNTLIVAPATIPVKCVCHQRLGQSTCKMLVSDPISALLESTGTNLHASSHRHRHAAVSSRGALNTCLQATFICSVQQVLDWQSIWPAVYAVSLDTFMHQSAHPPS